MIFSTYFQMAQKYRMYIYDYQIQIRISEYRYVPEFLNTKYRLYVYIEILCIYVQMYMWVGEKANVAKMLTIKESK